MLPEEIQTVRLDRGACFGECPVYEVELRADGTARWRGDHHVERLGEYRGSFEPSKLRELAGAVVDSGFFDRDEEYSAVVTDMPREVIEVTTPDVNKRGPAVWDWRAGELLSAPRSHRCRCREH